MLCVTALNQIAPVHVAFGNIPLSKFKTCSLLPHKYACCSMISLIVKDIMHNKTSIKHLSKKKKPQFGKVCVPVLFNFSGMLLGKSLSH